MSDQSERRARTLQKAIDAIDDDAEPIMKDNGDVAYAARPEDVAHAIRLLASHVFERSFNREEK